MPCYAVGKGRAGLWNLQKLLDKHPYLPPEALAQLNVWGPRFQGIWLDSASYADPKGQKGAYVHDPATGAVDLALGEIIALPADDVLPEEVTASQLINMPSRHVQSALGSLRAFAAAQQTVIEPPQSPEEYGSFQQAIEATLVARAEAWIADFLGIAGGPWSWVVATVITLLRGTRGIANGLAEELEKRDVAYTAYMAQTVSVPRPSNIEIRSDSATVNANVIEPLHIAEQSFAIPFDQTVKLQWNMNGHWALFKVSSAFLDLICNRGGSVHKVFTRRVEGRDSESSEVTLTLQAGGYVLRATRSNPYSRSQATIEFENVVARPVITQPAKPLQASSAPLLFLGLVGGAFALTTIGGNDNGATGQGEQDRPATSPVRSRSQRASSQQLGFVPRGDWKRRMEFERLRRR